MVTTSCDIRVILVQIFVTAADRSLTDFTVVVIVGGGGGGPFLLSFLVLLHLGIMSKETERVTFPVRPDTPLPRQPRLRHLAE